MERIDAIRFIKYSTVDDGLTILIFPHSFFTNYIYLKENYLINKPND
jgi:hypothetical protein